MDFNSSISHNKLTPVILGSSANAYGLVRSLSLHATRSIVMDYAHGPAAHSRFIHYRPCLSPAKDTVGFVNQLVSLGHELRQRQQKGFLLCSADEYLFAVGQQYNTLAQDFVLPMSPWEIVESCTDKSKLYPAARALGINCPETFVVNNLGELAQASQNLPYPVIVKPAVTIGFTERLGLKKKAVQVDNAAEMIQLIQRMDALDMQKICLILQEYIPGPQENLFTISTYTDAKANIRAYSVGHKIRQYPPDAGTITSGRTQCLPELYELGKTILKGMHFHGIANTEFKKDARTGQFRLIEINPRPGLWNYSATAAGANLPYTAYLDALDNLPKGVIAAKKEIVWCLDVVDLYSSIILNRSQGDGNAAINFRTWRSSLAGKKVYALWNMRDMLPFCSYVTAMAASLVRKGHKAL